MDKKLKPLLQIDHLNVSYGFIQALKNVSLKVMPGSIVSLVGTNGAGKTTLMKSIMGILGWNSSQMRNSKIKVHCEQMIFNSHSLISLETHQIVQKGLSLSPEGRMIFSDLTVYENLVLGAYSQKLSQQKMDEKIEEVFSLFSLLKERRKQLGGTLSGGEQQMLAIARAWISSPQLLLLDEPSLGVSPLMTQKIFDLLVHLNHQGTSILLAEQNALMGLRISNYAYVLEVGKVVTEGTGSKLIESDQIRKTYLGINDSKGEKL